MSAWLAMAKRWATRSVLNFRADQRGNIAIIFGLSSTLIVTGLGASVDLARSYSARQKLSQVAELTCQYSIRPSVVNIANSDYASTYGGTSAGFATYISTVNTFASNALANQHWTGPVPTAGSSGTYFSATQAATASAATAPTNPIVELNAQVPTFFMQIVNVPQIPVHAKVACLTASTTPQIVTSTGPSSSVNFIAQETFAGNCGTICWRSPNGTSSNTGAPTATPSSATTPTPGYTGDHGLKWFILGYCLEQDLRGVINATTIGSNSSAELDCDNGSGSAGNSSISTQFYMAPGRYELRYNYRSRIAYPNYDPTYICASTAADLSWANDTVISGAGSASDNGAAYRTNQVNVYLDMVTSSTVPLHTTLDGTQQLGGTNLIDMCVYSPTWVQRSVKITVTTPAYYWLSFAADGQNDSYGGQLDNIMVCQETCVGTPTDNFPSTWLAANNGGVNKVLFEDGFESPVYTQDPYTSSNHAKGGNLANSYGTTVSTGCYYGATSSVYASPPGWPCRKATGWSVAPYNQAVYWMQGATQGSQYISLQGWNGFSNSSDPLNRSVSRSFLLDPGYYNVSYNYASLVDFQYSFVYNNGYYPVCTAVPTTVNGYTNFGLKTGSAYPGPTLLNQYLSTNFMNVYMANGQSVSTPTVNTTTGGAPTYNNPDGSTSSSPTVPLDNGSNFASYSATAVNPVIDSCYYSQGYGWVARSINIKITKPGLYWLDFSAQGDPLTNLGAGPALDNVKLTALGSPYMSGAPTTSLAAIPTPSPKNDTNYYGPSNAFNGFYIVANPFTPPAADQ